MEFDFTKGFVTDIILNRKLNKTTLSSVGKVTEDDVEVEITGNSNSLDIYLTALKTAVRGIHIRFNQTADAGSLYLDDAWERASGDLSWHTLIPERVMPWYFFAKKNETIVGLGVKTDSKAFASFQADSEGTSLYLDTRNGGDGVILNGRKIKLASLITERAQKDSWQFCRDFAKKLVVQKIREIKKPVYGFNNWYYAYGDIDTKSVLQDAKITAKWTEGLENRPYMIIDDGWEVSYCDGRYNGGPWHTTNRKFESMAGLASEIKNYGVCPGIWYRPLVSLEGLMEPFMIKNGKKPSYAPSGYALDPTFPQVAERLKEDASRLVEWGYDFIKHDFTSVDLFGSWAGSRQAVVSPYSGWHFNDRSKTNAEIVVDLYTIIRESAKDAVILGCETFGHLGVSLFDLQRVGGDVDGRGWEFTRRMGINSLAFRMHQHDIFYQIDADCAPITKTLPWSLAASWLELLAKSGTPCFISADINAVDTKEKEDFIVDMIRIASQKTEPAKALDWEETTVPRKWQTDKERLTFNWTSDIGVAPRGLLNADEARMRFGLIAEEEVSGDGNDKRISLNI